MLDPQGAVVVENRNAVTFSTKSPMAAFGAVSFHDGSGSVCAPDDPANNNAATIPRAALRISREILEFIHMKYSNDLLPTARSCFAMTTARRST
jgi:hypothetical protein